MPQTMPIVTRLRDVYEDAMEDGHICTVEQAEIHELIVLADDGFHVAQAFLRTGSTRRTQRLQREYEAVHGPVDIDQYRNETRPMNCTSPDAA